MTADPPTLSIVVMFTHDGEQAARCLKAVAVARSEIPDSETIIVLNRASDAVRSAVAAEATDARLIDSPANTGTAVAWQLGFTAARGEFVLLLHEDAEPLPGMTGKLIETMSAEPKAAAIGPWIDELRGEPSINAGWLRFGRLGARLTPDQLPDGLADSPYAVNEISSSISLWRRSAWEDLGGFEERTFPAMGVEPDAFTGLWARGYTVLVEPAARGRHSSGAMDSGTGLLSGPHVRHYLTERFLEVWGEKWSERADWFVGPDGDVDAAIERAQELRASPPILADPPASRQPLTNPTGKQPGPVEIDPAVVDRLRAAERGVIDGYTRWLIDRDIEMTERYEATHAAYMELGDRVEALEERSRTLDAFLTSRRWRLRRKFAR